MRLDKILKREEKLNRNFLIFMSLLFVILPLVLYLSRVKSLFILIFLIIIEILIVLCIIIRINYYKLNFIYSNNKLKVRSGIFSKQFLITCDKVSIIHTVKFEEDIEVVIVTTSNIKNKLLKPISGEFIKKYPEAANEYIKLKKMYPENLYYYQVVKKGGFKKYLLLDTIFKNCVKAIITESAVNNIKISRGQCEL